MIGEMTVHTTHAPFLTPSGAIPSFIQPTDDCLNSHGTGRPIAFEGEVEHKAHHGCITFINNQAFFKGFSAPFDLHNAIPKRRVATVPETLQGIFVEAAPDMLCRLERLVFIEYGQDAPHQMAFRTFARMLRQADHTNTAFRQRSDVEFTYDLIPKKAAE
ncbi:hypothetical protein Q4605_12135 [Shimia thalassica]|nr:hypothetical protein [Shimia thalassica]MDO6799195.1 hypothetical protein [Shimia thalassica]